MKISLLPLALALSCLLSGCHLFLDSTYVSVEPHHVENADSQESVTVQSYLSLRNAVLDMISHGINQEIIQIYDYSGDLDEDLEVVAYEMSNNDPLGAYATSAIDYDLAFVMSHYEATFTITYRRSLSDIRSVESLTSDQTLEARMHQAMEKYEHKVVVREPFYTDVDLAALALDYYKSFPTDCVQLPQITVNTYPNRGFVRVVEVFFNYTYSPQELEKMTDDVVTGVNTAAEYVRYRSSARQKVKLLYNYFLDRFSYTWDETDTPVYSFLSEGVAGGDGPARALDAICKKIGIASTVVEGTKGDIPYTWNVLQLEDGYYHVDLLGNLMAGDTTVDFYYDKEMKDYSWNSAKTPICAPPLTSFYPVPLPEESPTTREITKPNS